MSEISPGPWTADTVAGILYFGDTPANDAAWLLCYWYGTDADLQLMAAAPDLLAACEALVNDVYSEARVRPCILGDMHAAIQKARGEP